MGVLGEGMKKKTHQEDRLGKAVMMRGGVEFEEERKGEMDRP